MIRKLASGALAGQAPFQEWDWVESLENPGRKFVVAHCYPLEFEGEVRWVVAEINSDTHPAERLRKIASNHGSR